MPITVSELFKRVDLEIDGVVRWGTLPEEQSPGVYVVAISGKTNKLICIDTIPISHDSISNWISRVTMMRIDHRVPTVESLSERLAQFWLPNETILYIGRTSRPLRARIAEMYNHVLGDRWHHSGGQWLKTLNNYEDLYVYYSVDESQPERLGDYLLSQFHSAVSTDMATDHFQVVMPFANRQAPAIDPNKKYFRKEHYISSQVI